MDNTIRLAYKAQFPYDKVIEQLNRYLAALMLMIILGATVLFFPVTYLGYDTTFDTQKIVYIEPGSPAERAGIHVGDRIVKLYNHPIEEVEKRLDVVRLIGSPQRPVPISVERDGEILTATLHQEPPPFSFQAVKLAMCGLALTSWITGYLLGVVRRHEVPGSPVVASFWLLMSGLLGSLMFTMFTALPIFVIELWIFITFLAPLSVYIHLYFPVQQFKERVGFVRLCFLGVSIVLNGLLVLLINVYSYSAFIGVLFLASSWVIVISLTATGLLLTRSYYRAVSEHVRRQIRLITGTCLSLTLVWTLLLVVPNLVLGYSLIRPSVLTLSLGAIPASYLVGIRSANLYRLDRVARRFVLHIITTTIVSTLAAFATRLAGYSGAPAVLWMTVVFILLYRPVQRFWTYLFPNIFRPQNQQALQQAIQKLPTTLKQSSLVDIVVSGLRAQFGQPALAFFLSDIRGAGSLTRVQADRMDSLPREVLPGTLMMLLARAHYVIQSRDLRERVDSTELRKDEQILLNHPAIVLWCPIKHSHGHLLGLLVLGMQADVDPYTSHDQQGLQQLIASASLALGHSVAFEQQVDDHAEIRDLYQALQSAQDHAAEALARQLHDQIINGNMRLNLEELKKIVRRIHDNNLRNSLEVVLRRERDMIYELRRISDELHPIGIDDPVGLPTVLRMETERQNRLWEGECQFAQSGDAIPLPPRVQYEAFRIVREAINNAIKHADATRITVYLEYPVQQGRPIQLVIRDDGSKAQSVSVQRGHCGVRYMHESARTLGGKLSVEIDPGKSTTIRCVFPSEKPPQS